MPTIAHYTVTMGKARWAFQRHHGKAGTRAGGRGRSTGHVTTKSNRAPITHLVGGRNVSRKVSCDAIGIYYASTTGNTEAAAEWVKDLMVRSKLVWLGSFSSTRPSLCLLFFQTDRSPKTSLKTAWRDHRNTGNRRGGYFWPRSTRRTHRWRPNVAHWRCF